MCILLAQSWSPPLVTCFVGHVHIGRVAKTEIKTVRLRIAPIAEVESRGSKCVQVAPCRLWQVGVVLVAVRYKGCMLPDQHLLRLGLFDNTTQAIC
jgi:hypothetical protein